MMMKESTTIMTLDDKEVCPNRRASVELAMQETIVITPRKLPEQAKKIPNCYDDPNDLRELRMGVLESTGILDESATDHADRGDERNDTMKKEKAKAHITFFGATRPNQAANQNPQDTNDEREHNNRDEENPQGKAECEQMAEVSPMPPDLNRSDHIPAVPGAHRHTPIGAINPAVVVDGTERSLAIGGDDDMPLEDGDHNNHGLVEASPVSLPTGTAEPIDLEAPTTRRSTNQAKTKSNQHYLIVVTLFLCLLILVIGLAVGLSRSNSSSNLHSTTGSQSNSGASNNAYTNSTDSPPWEWGLPFTPPPDVLRSLLWDKEEGKITAISKAYDWMEDDPNLHTYSEERLLQRLSLAHFYFSTHGENWTHQGGETVIHEVKPKHHNPLVTHGGNSSIVASSGAGDLINNGDVVKVNITLEKWLSYDSSECDWFSSLSLGLVDWQICNEDQSYEYLDFRMKNGGLSGTMPETLGLLSNLKYLHLARSPLGGTIITQLGAMKKLEEIHLVKGALTGSIPSQLGMLSNTLKIIAAMDNMLSGTIPTSLVKLSKLERLMLDKNDFSGTLPDGIGRNMPDLKLFMVAFNQMKGSIPTSIGLATNLINVGLLFGQLTGTIPTQFGRLQNVGAMLLSNNLLSGSLPSELGKVPLFKFRVDENVGLTGTLPVELENWNATINMLDIRGTSITGTIPSGLCNIKDLSFDCSDVLCGCSGCPCV